MKTQNWFDFRGALTIPDTKQIEYRAFLGGIFNWHGLCSAFSHNLGRESEFAEPVSSRSVRIGDRQLGDTAMLIILERQIIGCF